VPGVSPDTGYLAADRDIAGHSSVDLGAGGDELAVGFGSSPGAGGTYGSLAARESKWNIWLAIATLTVNNANGVAARVHGVMGYSGFISPPVGSPSFASLPPLGSGQTNSPFTALLGTMGCGYANGGVNNYVDVAPRSQGQITILGTSLGLPPSPHSSQYPEIEAMMAAMGGVLATGGPGIFKGGDPCIPSVHVALWTSEAITVRAGSWVVGWLLPTHPETWLGNNKNAGNNGFQIA